jgi:hypothetical protein
MKEFQAVFQLSKLIIFEVYYYTLSTNKNAHFTTSAAEFCKNKKDFCRCGQAQDDLTRGFATARRFWKKWDALHLKTLTPEQYNELQADLQALKDKYNYIYNELDETKKPYSPNFSFYRLAEWTKQPPKK